MWVRGDTIIGDILDRDTACEEVFLAFGMPCMGCPSSRGETLEEACSIHDVALDVLLEALNKRFTV